MKNNKLMAGIAVVVVLVAVGVILMGSGNDKKTSSSTGDSMSQTEMKKSDAASKDSSTANSTPMATDKVTISNYKFGPSAITVKAGTTVTWTNTDSVRHNIDPDTMSADFTAGDLFGKGESYSFTFNKAGTYTYHCSPHPYMHGTVVVKE